MKHLAPFLLFLFASIPGVFAQNDFSQKKDSILNVISSSEGKEKLDAYDYLVMRIAYTDEETDELIAYFERYVEEAQRQDNPQEIRKALGKQLNFLYNYDLTELFLSKIEPYLAYFAKHEFWNSYYHAWQSKLEILFAKGEYTQTLQEAQGIYRFAQQQKNNFGIATAANAIGLIYQRTTRPKEAETYYKEALDKLSGGERIEGIQLEVYLGLCEVLVEQKKFEEATGILAQWEEVIPRRLKQLGTDKDLVGAYNYYLTATIVYVGMGDYEKAAYYCSLGEQQLPGVDRAEVNLCYYRAQILNAQGKYNEALRSCEKAYRITQALHEISFSVDVQKLQIEILHNMGRGSEIYPIYEVLINRDDSIRNEAFNAQLDELRTIYQVDKLTEEKLRQRNYFLFTLGICALLLITLFLWIRYSRKLQFKNRNLVARIREEDRLEKELEAREAELARLRLLFQPQATEEAHSTDENQLYQQLKQLMKDKSVFTNPDLSRRSLADMLGTNEKYLHETIKQCTGLKYSDYITRLRLAYAKELLADKSNPIIAAIADNAGFGSKVTFHRQFREYYGLTPEEYRKLTM